jgi:cysteine desulfurase/selenocysteine lyase
MLQHRNIKFVESTPDGIVDLDHLQEIVNQKTKLVAITYVSNVAGNIQPVKEIASLCKKYQAISLIDAAQAAGHFPIDVKSIDCDFLTVSVHKMLGPSGVGVLYGKEEKIQGLSTYRFGGGMINRFNSSEKLEKEGYERFEAGTPNVEGLIGLGGALSYYQSVGLEKVSAYLKELDDYFYVCLQNSFLVNWVYPINKEKHIPTYSFKFKSKSMSVHDMAILLSNSHNISVNSGMQCANLYHESSDSDAAIRLSLHIYNDKDEIDQFFDVMNSLRILWE